jgi:hypothetical protein
MIEITPSRLTRGWKPGTTARQSKTLSGRWTASFYLPIRRIRQNSMNNDVTDTLISNSLHLSPRGRQNRSRFALVPLLLAMGMFGLRGTLRAGTDDSDKDKDKDKKVLEKAPDPRIKYSFFLEAGITGNPNDPNDHQNFGRVFDDRANEPMLNQATATIERALAPESGKFDWGFKLQAGVGSDGRFINTLGTLENVDKEIIMPYVVEAYGNVHAPLTFINKDAGVDVRFGQFVTLLGAETIDPRTNVFYSHDYIFNFGIPLQHLGVLSTVHYNPTLDLYAGITRGANTSIYDNNGYAAFLGGFGLNNLVGGKLTLLATVSAGPENPRELDGTPSYNGSGFVHRDNFRYYGDVVATYKCTDKLTSTAEGVYTYDDGFDASFYGGADTLSYAVNDKWTVSARFEAVRDSEGFYVTQFGAYDDFTNVERGVTPLDPRTVGGGPNTYLDSTFGVEIKPLKFLTVRPEVRVDYSTSAHSRPFDDSSKQWSVTIGGDAIIAF